MLSIHDAQIIAANQSNQSPLDGRQLITLVNQKGADTPAYQFVWAMAALVAVIDACIPFGINQFDVASQVLASASNLAMISQCSALGTRLQLDLEVWKSIAQITGLQKEISRWMMTWLEKLSVPQLPLRTEPLEQAETKEMVRLLRWMWFETEPITRSEQSRRTWTNSEFAITYEVVYATAYSLEKVGMGIHVWEGASIGESDGEEIGFARINAPYPGTLRVPTPHTILYSVPKRPGGPACT